MLKRVKPAINVLDVGFDDAKRINALARKHPGKRFMGIEVTKQKGIVTRQHNLKLVYGDAIQKLQNLPNEHVKIVTADFMFSEFKVGGKIQDELPLPASISDEFFHDQRKKVLSQCMRVLLPHGKLVIVEYNESLRSVLTILDELGLKYSVREVPSKDKSKTKFLKFILDYLEKHPEKKEDYKPMQITITKK
tara:strand:+ start:8415 stop:8990 length:576 start_codon:yes stop_codon:yes gene_type:complete